MNYQNYTPQYITYHKIIDFMESVQQASPRLKSFGHGDVVYFSQTLTGGTATYPYMFVTPMNISYAENTTQYQLNVIFGDIVNTDLSNEVDVVSDMSLEARNLLSQIYRGSLFNDVADVQLPTSATPFLERFNDHIGGVSLDLVITVMEDMNACPMYDLPAPTESPICDTPTPTSTTTATPTPTTTSTPTNTPTITTTPTNTPTNTGTPTPTPTCPVFTTQYLRTEVSGFNNIKVTLFDTSGFTGNANAVCDYTISGTCLESGITRTWSNTIQSNDHTHTFSTGFGTITNPITTSIIPICGCVNVIPVTTP